MDDQAGVRVSDGTRHEQEEPQAGAQRQMLRLRILVDRPPLDVFECEVRLAAAGDPCVVQPCDVRMVQRRQDFAFLREPFGEILRLATRPLAA